LGPLVAARIIAVKHRPDPVSVTKVASGGPYGTNRMRQCSRLLASCDDGELRLVELLAPGKARDPPAVDIAPPLDNATADGPAIRTVCSYFVDCHSGHAGSYKAAASTFVQSQYPIPRQGPCSRTVVCLDRGQL